MPRQPLVSRAIVLLLAAMLCLVAVVGLALVGFVLAYAYGWVGVCAFTVLTVGTGIAVTLAGTRLRHRPTR